MKKYIKIKLVKKIWEPLLLKNYFNKVSGKHVRAIDNIKILKLKLVKNMWVA